jgi:hypothetical protein
MPIDMSNAKAPPRKKTPATRTPTKVVPETSDNSLNAKRVDGVLGLAQIGQALCVMLGQNADAAAIGTHFPPIAQELANIADSNDAIAKPIDFLLEVGPYGALIAAVLPFGLQIAANHGWVDASRLMGQGVVPPAVLEAQMQAQIARMQTEAVRQQQEAINEARKASAAYEQMMADEQVAQNNRVAEAMAR